MSDSDVSDAIDRFEERMAKRKEEEAKRDAEVAEAQRQAYLRRTGRTEMKP